MRVRIRVHGTTIDGELDDNPTSRDLVSLLPLTFVLEDFASSEKMGYPPRKLSTKDAPSGSTPAAGDISYYAPWGDIALFYRGGSHAAGLVKIGRLDDGGAALSKLGPSTRATIELVAP